MVTRVVTLVLVSFWCANLTAQDTAADLTFTLIHVHKFSTAVGKLTISARSVQWEEVRPRGDDRHNFTITCAEIKQLRRPKHMIRANVLELDMASGEYVFVSSAGDSVTTVAEAIAQRCGVSNPLSGPLSESSAAETAASGGGDAIPFDVTLGVFRGVLYVSNSGIRFRGAGKHGDHFSAEVACEDISEVKINNRLNLPGGFIVVSGRQSYQFVAANISPIALKEVIADRCTRK